MAVIEESSPELHETLECAVEACRHALADYRSGIIDATELRRALFRWGLVQWPDAAWLLDLQTGTWWRYDGVGIGGTPLTVTDAELDRLRVVVDEMAGEAEASASASANAANEAGGDE